MTIGRRAITRILTHRRFYLPIMLKIDSYKKILYIVSGTLCLILGSIGLFVPILPTTPFWLLTAWLYTRSSPYLYRKVMNIPLFGNCIRNFHEYKAIPLRGKIITITTLWITIGISIWIIAKVWIAILLIAIAIGITIHILSYKTLPPDIPNKKDIH